MNLYDYTSYHVISDSNQYYLFDIYNMLLCSIDENTYYALHDKTFSSLPVQTQEKLILLAQNDCFFHQLSDKKYTATTSDTGYFSFAPVSNCNLRCKYCFAESGEVVKGTKMFSKELITAICDFMITEFMPNAKRFRFDFVGGGEPLLNKPLLKDTIGLLEYIFNKYHKPLKIWLCTNGTLLDDDITAFFDRHHINVGISLDGPEKTHDACRPLENGKGSYQTIVNNVQNVLQNPQFSNHVKDLWGLCVLSSQSENYIDLLQHHKALGFSSMQMKIARLSKNNPLSLNNANLSDFECRIDELLCFSFNQANQGNIQELLFFLNDNDHIGKIVRRIFIRKPYIYRCHAAQAKLSFDAEGNIYPCDSFVGHKAFVIGHVYKGIDEQKQAPFKSLSIYDRQPCRTCWARFVCGGDCYHNSFVSNHNVSVPDPIFCEIVKFVAEKSIIHINKLQQNNYEIYETLYKTLIVRDKLYGK